jgi:hypothetical protein
MHRNLLPRFAVLCGLLLTGCAADPGTRLPSIAANDANQERASYQLHDPLPEYDTGPFGSSGRPRGFDVSRSGPRKAVDKSLPTMPYSGRSAASVPRSASVVQP